MMRFPVRSARGLLLVALFSVATVAAAQDPSPAPAGNPLPPAPAPAPAAPPAKPKKVFTNDDVAPAAPIAANVTKTKSNGTPSDPNAKLAHDLKVRLDKLNTQLSDTDKQLDDLKKFQSGESVGTSGGQVYRGYKMEPVPEQIQKLEAKRQQIAAQIDDLYDEARKKGILPGQLR
jgi:hypothetical protein